MQVAKQGMPFRCSQSILYFVVSIVLVVNVLQYPKLVYADPSEPIRNMMNTPATTFDVFLSDLQRYFSCQDGGWLSFSANTIGITSCMAQIEYNFEDNLIVMHFITKGDTPLTANFSTQSEAEKEKTTKQILARIAMRVGVEESDIITQGGKPAIAGAIQYIPIRYGWSNTLLDEAAIREEIAKRTVINLIINIDDGNIYNAVRDQHGKVTYNNKSFAESVR